MSTLTKNQHYVWRNYLKEWVDRKGNLFCYIQDERRIFPTRPTNIAVERYFYKVEELSALDLSWINSIIDRASQPEARAFHRETVEIFQYVFKLRARLAAQEHLTDEVRAALMHELDIMEKTLGERWHTGIENNAQGMLANLKQCDPRFYEDDTKRTHFIFFLAQQFFRTPKIRELQLRKGNPYFDQGLDLDRTWFIESQIYAMNISTGIYLEKDHYKFKFLENPTDIEFVTGDQPVVSLGPDVNGMHFFYPLGPKLALIFEKDLTVPLGTRRSVSTFEVEFYNNKMYQQSYNQLYGNDGTYLEVISAMPKDVLMG